jgi:MYND finger
MVSSLASEVYHREGIAILTKAAEMGCPQASYRLGLAYYKYLDANKGTGGPCYQVFGLGRFNISISSDGLLYQNPKAPRQASLYYHLKASLRGYTTATTLIVDALSRCRHELGIVASSRYYPLAVLSHYFKKLKNANSLLRLLAIGLERLDHLLTEAALLSSTEDVLRKKCTVCHKEAVADASSSIILSTCSRCKYYCYCSRICQVEHWNKGHKNECKLIQALQKWDIKRSALIDVACTHSSINSNEELESEIFDLHRKLGLIGSHEFAHSTPNQVTPAVMRAFNWKTGTATASRVSFEDITQQLHTNIYPKMSQPSVPDQNVNEENLERPKAQVNKNKVPIDEAEGNECVSDQDSSVTSVAVPAMHAAAMPQTLGRGRKIEREGNPKKKKNNKKKRNKTKK